MKKLVDHMKIALRKLFYKHLQEQGHSSKAKMEKEKMLKVLKNQAGQILITSAQIQWTSDVKAALIAYEGGNKKIMM